MCKDKYPRDRPASGLHTRNWHTQEISKVMSSVSRKWTWAQTSVEGDQVEDVDVGHIVATVDIDGLYQPDAHPYPHQDEVVTQQKDAPEEPHAQDWNTNGVLLMKKQKKVHKLLHEYYTCIKFGTFKELHLKSCWFILIHPQWKTTSESWVKCDTSVLIKKKTTTKIWFCFLQVLLTFTYNQTSDNQTICQKLNTTRPSLPFSEAYMYSVLCTITCISLLYDCNDMGFVPTLDMFPSLLPLFTTTDLFL